MPSILTDMLSSEATYPSRFSYSDSLKKAKPPASSKVKTSSSVSS